MPEQAQSLHSQSLKATGKTYFFDVKAAKNGNKYLSITESRMRDGQKYRSTITVFSDNIEEFSDILAALKDKLG